LNDMVCADWLALDSMWVVPTYYSNATNANNRQIIRSVCVCVWGGGFAIYTGKTSS
jgi:hypothetical protein